MLEIQNRLRKYVQPMMSVDGVVSTQVQSTVCPSSSQSVLSHPGGFPNTQSFHTKEGSPVKHFSNVPCPKAPPRILISEQGQWEFLFLFIYRFLIFVQTLIFLVHVLNI